MALYVDQIFVKFPHKSFPVINVKPYYRIIHDLCTLLYNNASTLTTNIGRFNHGHIWIVMQDTLYATISPVPYAVPMDLGGIATFTLPATAAQRLQLQDKHSESCSIHDKHHNMNLSLKTMVLNAVDNTYVFVLHNAFIVYMGLLTKYIMNHLMDRCGQITASDINMKKASFQEPLDTSHIIGFLFGIIDYGVRYASKFNTPSTLAKLIKWHITLLACMGYNQMLENIGI